MVGFTQFCQALKEPFRFGRYSNKIYHSKIRNDGYNQDGFDFFEADWDNLIILDGCRYDTFESEHGLDGELQKRISMASATPEFIRTNLAGKTLHDTVYISANGYVSYFLDELDYEFHRLVDFFDEKYWDDQFETVLPETLISESKDIIKEYDDKRFVIHFIQPHWPFLSDDLFDRMSYISNYDDRDVNFWDEYRKDKFGLTDEQLKEAYRETLRRTLPSVQRLIDMLDGRSVVTADHGQMFGERSFPIPIREYGHPTKTYTPELVEVPWFVANGDTRRDIVAEPPANARAELDDKLVKERLNQLGYVE